MTWHAKPSGSYDYTTGAGLDNLYEMANELSGWTDAAIAGAIGNSVHEGGMNPWRWQGDSYNPSMGYGLFQYTPGSGYTSLSGATPNLSTTSITSGATPEDGAYQVQVMKNNTLGKWVSSCWRSYWSTSTYATLYSYSRTLVNTYGDGSSISMAQYAAIQDDVDACTFIFLACFEGPRVPNYSTRKATAAAVYQILTGYDPPTPPIPPGPSPEYNTPLWLLFKNNNWWRGKL